jgi:hypothetical protein
MLRESDM